MSKKWAAKRPPHCTLGKIYIPSVDARGNEKFIQGVLVISGVWGVGWLGKKLTIPTVIIHATNATHIVVVRSCFCCLRMVLVVESKWCCCRKVDSCYYLRLSLDVNVIAGLVG